MIALRRICLALVLVGAVMLLMPQDNWIETLPVPPGGRQVSGTASISSPGEYTVVVQMTKMDNDLGLTSETVPCSFSVSVRGPEEGLQKQEIKSLTRYGEAGVQFYRGGEAFRLEKGDYQIIVRSQATTEMAATRGATISLEQDVGNPTDYFIRRMVRSWLVTAAITSGLVGLIFCEFKSPKRTALALPQRSGQLQD